MDKVQEIMALVDAYADACFDQALYKRDKNENTEKARFNAEAALRALLEHRSGKVLVCHGALQMVLNALERDAHEGKQSRKEMRRALIETIE